MKIRLTRPRDSYPCRAKYCQAEDWIVDITGVSVIDWKQDYICDSCPFEELINKLAEYEDNAERMEDDLK